MKTKKIIGWTAFGVGAFLILIIAVIAVAMIFGITINLGGIRGRVDEAATRVIGTSIRFITGPLHVPVRRLFTKALPSTGDDICFKAIER